MKEIPNSILASLEALFLQFNIRRLLFWLFIIAAVFTLLLVADGLTGYTFFLRLERKAELLKSLNDLARDGITSRGDLNPIYNEMVAELAVYKVESSILAQVQRALSSLSLSIPEWVGKFASGGLLGFLVSISGLSGRKKGGSEWTSQFWGGLFFGILGGLLGVVIPTIYNPWVNYIGYPIAEVAFILLVSKFSKKRTA